MNHIDNLPLTRECANVLRWYFSEEHRKRFSRFPLRIYIVGDDFKLPQSHSAEDGYLASGFNASPSEFQHEWLAEGERKNMEYTMIFVMRRSDA